MALAPRVVVVYRRSQLDELTAQHSTLGQVQFLLAVRGESLEGIETAHEEANDAVRTIGNAIPADWRRASVERADLPQFLFGKEDIIAVVGRDGLVANVAKYLDGQPVVGFNPFPDTNAGILTPFDPATASAVLARVASGGASISERAMVRAQTDDGQQVTALNDVYIGDQGHQSARYRLTVPGRGEEEQSSSGIIVGTGTGATGWLASLAHDRGLDDLLPAPRQARLAWFVREAWPSPFTQVELNAGALDSDQSLTLTVRSETLVAFGDGVETDWIDLEHGQQVEVGIAPQRLRLVEAPDRA